MFYKEKVLLCICLGIGLLSMANFTVLFLCHRLNSYWGG